jgi:hypothetical protein
MQVITTSAVMRGPKKIDLKKIVDKALVLTEENGFKVRSKLCLALQAPVLIYTHPTPCNLSRTGR